MEQARRDGLTSAADEATEVSAVDRASEAGEVHSLGFDPISLHASTAFDLLRIVALLSDEFDRALGEQVGLGLSETLVLVQLMFAEGRIKMAELAETLVVTRGGISKIVDRLVDSGLVERVPSASDRRVVFAIVTDEGKALVRKCQPIFDEIAQRRLVDVATPAEWPAFADAVGRISCDNPGWEPPHRSS